MGCVNFEIGLAATANIYAPCQNHISSHFCRSIHQINNTKNPGTWSSPKQAETGSSAPSCVSSGVNGTSWWAGPGLLGVKLFGAEHRCESPGAWVWSQWMPTWPFRRPNESPFSAPQFSPRGDAQTARCQEYLSYSGLSPSDFRDMVRWLSFRPWKVSNMFPMASHGQIGMGMDVFTVYYIDCMFNHFCKPQTLGPWINKWAAQMWKWYEMVPLGRWGTRAATAKGWWLSRRGRKIMVRNARVLVSLRSKLLDPIKSWACFDILVLSTWS